MNENKSGFSLEWDKFYFENNGSKWPWTDLVSLYSNIFKNNSIEVDNSTRIFKEDSNFKGLGKVNFVNESDILSFFKDFEFIHFKKKVIKDLLNKNDLVFYDFVIKK